MTKEENIKNLKQIKKVGLCKKYLDSIDEAIKALEQQPCDDCVSLSNLKDIIGKLETKCNSKYGRDSIYGEALCDFAYEIRTLPPVTPTSKAPREDITDDEVRINMLELAFNQAKEHAESIEVLTDNHRLIFKAEKRGELDDSN